MPNAYLSPGVYVQEIPSAVQAIAGVGTSTAGFLAIVPDTVSIPERNPDYDPAAAMASAVAPSPVTKASSKAGDDGAKSSEEAKGSDGPTPPLKSVVGAAPDKTSRFLLRVFPIAAPAGEPRLFTNFAEFKQSYGDFSTDPEHNMLVHAVFGFFNNGGTRLYVTRMVSTVQLNSSLQALESVDEIAIVAAPGITDTAVRAALVAHCDATGNRFAIMDTPETVNTIDASLLPDGSKNAAVYFPWVQVFDPGVKTRYPDGPGLTFVPPSGHMAGIYARTDSSRGVHKAPANEVVLGALGLKYPIRKSQQDGLNNVGVNCIRSLNGNIRVWGARTIGGDRNGEWRYINVRRTALFLYKSIDEGTQWVVFEPNDLSLWAKITRNVTAFLTTVWRDGALFGATAAEAFYVKCDRETNPPELRELGQVVTEIGVAIVRPAEFVVFRLSQWTGPQGQ
ncbi:phage tail sheath family protein [Terriglobus albidus]|uniref:Phage tail sheath family protein n=1 Tax=Terriglobus albidus TaxID=1592106 RepID=A0A5B9EFX3_9BACT|nr:phage tail sheath subtilisin-like domain-containing protein [Terriglobus albidus]QEE29670.1 phage tail sheath family protein [Terriglobus albidus]